jgi:hypothetical protein
MKKCGLRNADCGMKSVILALRCSVWATRYKGSRLKLEFFEQKAAKITKVSPAYRLKCFWVD